MRPYTRLASATIVFAEHNVRHTARIPLSQIKKGVTMKRIVVIHLDNAEYDEIVRFLGQEIEIRHRGCNGDPEKARALIVESDGKVDAIGLEGLPAQLQLGSAVRSHEIGRTLPAAAGKTPSPARRLNELAAANGVGLWELLERIESQSGLTRAAMEGAAGFRRLIQRFRAEAARLSVDQLLTNLLTAIDYRAELQRVYDDAADRDARWASVEELVNAAAQFAKRNAKHDLAGFIQELVLTSTDDKEDQLEKNAVALMTMHAAKGLEFPEVYIVGMEEGILPHHRAVKEGETAVDEERRLCYVGVTRAQSRLTLTLSLSRMKWGKPRPTVPSRFLFELTGKAESPNYEKAKSHIADQAPPSKRTGARENKRAAR